MKILIDGLNIFYNEKLRIVKTLMKRESEEEYPYPMKWALQMLFFNGEKWIEICRIDNYLHENKIKSHIHVYKKEKVKWIDMDFQEADKMIKDISARILKDKFNENIRFEDY